MSIYTVKKISEDTGLSRRMVLKHLNGNILPAKKNNKGYEIDDNVYEKWSNNIPNTEQCESNTELDECITVSQKVTPIKEMPEELAYNLIMNETPYSSLTLVKSEPLNGNTCCYYYQGKNEYNYMDEIIDIKLTCTFDSKMGWDIQKETNTKQDWTKLCGEWYIQKYNSGYTYTYNVKVNSFDSTNNVADLDVHATTDSQYGFYGFCGIKEINEKVQGQIYAQTITENFQNTEYEVEMKFYGEDKNKTILELWTYWDRDTGLHLIYDPGFDAYFVPSKIS